MAPELMQRFCARDDDIREPLRKPWRLNGSIYMTNGHILLRIADDGRDVPDAAGRPDAEVLFKKNVRAEFAPLPNLPSKKTVGLCYQCGGRGVWSAADCEDCNGQGCFDHGNHEYQCKECDGDGRVEMEGAAESLCDVCDGDGESTMHGTDIGDARFATHYLRRLTLLPGLTVSIAGETDPMVFNFDGGAGLLMPMRKD